MILLAGSALTFLFSQGSARAQALYMGQEPPGSEPVIFAPGTVSTDSVTEYCMAFTPDAREIYFSRAHSGVMTCTLENGEWTGPEKAPFGEKYPGGEVHITPDGKNLLMNRFRELGEGEAGGVYILSKKEGGWGNPVLVVENGMRATTTARGEIYTTDITWFRNRQEGKDTGIIVNYVPSYTDYRKVADPGGGINTEFEEAHPFIAPDGSYIIFNSSRPGGVGKGDLYACYRMKDGSWSGAVNLEPLNTAEADWCATVSPDGKHLFFTRNITGMGDIYWVDAGIIAKMRPEE
jgi:hypothetical protein